MNTLNKLLLIFFSLNLGLNLYAQDDSEFEDLRNLYMDEKYEKLISKGEKYVADDKTRKSADPYLYLSKAYFEISKLEEFNEEYPPEKAFSNALKWASKYRKKDPEGALFSENDLYFRELKQSAMQEAAGFMSDGKYSRAKRYYDAICKFDPEDPGAWLMLGYAQVQMKSMTESKLAFKEAGKVLNTVDVTRLNSVERKLLLLGTVNYAEYLVEEGMRDSARVTLNLAAPALEGDAEFDQMVKRTR
jgi:hypothetical protein